MIRDSNRITISWNGPNDSETEHTLVLAIEVT